MYIAALVLGDKQCINAKLQLPTGSPLILLLGANVHEQAWTIMALRPSAFDLRGNQRIGCSRDDKF